MEKFNLEQLVEKYGPVKVMKAVQFANRDKPLPKRTMSKIEDYLCNEVVDEVFHDKKVLIGERTVRTSMYMDKTTSGGSEVSLKSLRPILLVVTDDAFKELAQQLIELAWFHGAYLSRLHVEVARKFPDMGRTHRGMLIKIIFTDNGFVLDRFTDPEDGAKMRRREGPAIMVPHAVSLACRKLMELRVEMLHALGEVKQKQSVLGNLV